MEDPLKETRFCTESLSVRVNVKEVASARLCV